MTNDGKGKHSFGPTQKSEGIWDEYIGQWVSVDAFTGNRCYSGKIVEIKDGCYAILSPFVGNDWTEKGFRRILKESRLSVCLMGANIEPTNKASINHYLKDYNKDRPKSRKKSK